MLDLRSFRAAIFFAFLCLRRRHDAWFDAYARLRHAATL